MPTEEEEASIRAELGQKPPEDFNAEYAKARVAIIEARKGKPMIDRVTVFVALVTSCVSILASVGAFYEYKLDRE